MTPRVDPRPPDPGSPVQFCYDEKEKILVVGYDDGTVVTFKDDVKILTQKYALIPDLILIVSAAGSPGLPSCSWTCSGAGQCQRG